ncbi:iron-sulfur cluster repair di-iron protein [Raineyella fluvialis]|uniref:Iron-sulfur cluster repair di-iron protein n=1 Tax=Raineyella fluvialis TaxID=2662261 RepID=A0A5Q2FBL2_9ACTN|nr:iron-sulfur cluster repair di-iron protein [Raineyella fluvialis]QGF24128.1 iron-sulfur cluster repair di-iron protein [Raineyella fluvialis]
MTTGPTTNGVDTASTLAQLVSTDARRARVLEDLGLDYCCHGNRPLIDAVEAAGLDLVDVARSLDLPAAGTDETALDDTPGRSDLAALAHDVVDTHHAYLWEEMPRLHALADKVARVHGERHPELARVKKLYLAAEADLDPHLTREERLVFPAISRLERTGQAVTTTQGPLEALVGTLIEEHDGVGEIFAELRTITDGYRTPADGCASYQALYAGLAEMEHDLHLHIHKENNVLFPATLQRITDLADATAGQAQENLVSSLSR